MATKKYLTISNNFYYNGKLFKEQEQYEKFSKACASGGGCGCGKSKSSKKKEICVWKITKDGKLYTLPEEYAFESDVLLGKEGEEGKDDIFQEVFNEGRGLDSKQSNMYHDMTTNYESVQNRNNPGAIRYAANHIKM